MYKLYYIGVAPLTRLAQSVERQPFKLVAVGSSPTSGIGMRQSLGKTQKSQGNGDIKPISGKTGCHYILRGIWGQ